MAKIGPTKSRPRSTPAEKLKVLAKRADRNKDKKLDASETQRFKGPAGDALREAVNVAGRFEQFPKSGFQDASTASLDEVNRTIDQVARSTAKNRELGVGPQTTAQDAFQRFEESLGPRGK
jgi:hypothetical protein